MGIAESAEETPLQIFSQLLTTDLTETDAIFNQIFQLAFADPQRDSEDAAGAPSRSR